jgi:short-subunit dehydrogenase
MNIIITGASSGIGYATALSLAKAGENKILAVSRSKSKLNKLKKKYDTLNSSSVFNIFSFDLESDDYSPLIEYSDTFFNLSRGEHIDIIINNAGFLINKSILETNATDILKSININTNSILKMLHSFMPYFSEKEITHIVNIGSMGGVQGTEKFPGLSAYSISKAAVNALTESMAVELAEYKIHTNCINPGAVQTEMLNKAFPGYTSEVSAEDFGKYLASFALNNAKLMNGRLISVSLRN